MAIDDQMLNIQTFNQNPHEEIREGHPELMDSGENLIDLTDFLITNLFKLQNIF